MNASERGLISLVALLIEKGAEVNHTDEDGEHALIEAATAGRTEVVALLLQNGAEINRQSHDGWTALMMASALGHCPAVKVLCEAGADLTKTNRFGRAALDYARGITGTNKVDTVEDIVALVDKGIVHDEERYYVLVRSGSRRDYDCVRQALEECEKRLSKKPEAAEPR